ncbi:hypothetical protein ACWEKT_17750 [Nocardia takedensis]|uniref:hypothetical protein n=1 Tax=Nocardia takedensis TaxID=259390 RepID=UPI0002F961CF|nr:hypothetical protein [Nocardia takedensis]
MSVRRQITYTDELLADGTVHRRYSDGRQEWRTRGPNAVYWRDNHGDTGTDEPLGRKLVKRTYANGAVRYARESGYGRTLWGDGTLTVNRSSFGGRLGLLLGSVAVGALAWNLVMPPESLTPLEEEELRRQAEAAAQSSGSSDYGSWDDYSDDDGDFG